MRLDIATMRAEAAKSKDKEIPPEMLAAHNDLIARYEASTDPAEQAKLYKQISMSLSTMSTAIGKPRGLPAAKEPKPVTESDIQGYIDSRSAQDPAFKTLPFDEKRNQAKAAISGQKDPLDALLEDRIRKKKEGSTPAAPKPSPSTPSPLPMRPTAARFQFDSDNYVPLKDPERFREPRR